MASALDTVRAAIEQAVIDCVEDDLELDASVISFPDVDFTPPTSAPWVRADVLWGGARKERVGTGGNSGTACSGLLKVKLYDVPGTGKVALTQRGDLVRDAFEFGTQIGAAFFFAPSPTRDASEDAWAGVVVDCPFEVREA